MKKENKTAKIIEELSLQWIGKNGVIGIFEEFHGSNSVIKFLVKDLKKNSKLLPKHYKEFDIEFEGIESIIPHRK
jgi:hypothetical protein